MPGKWHRLHAEPIICGKPGKWDIVSWSANFCVIFPIGKNHEYIAK